MARRRKLALFVQSDGGLVEVETGLNQIEVVQRQGLDRHSECQLTKILEKEREDEEYVLEIG